jgi:hypothetical protein
VQTIVDEGNSDEYSSYEENDYHYTRNGFNPNTWTYGMNKL